MKAFVASYMIKAYAVSTRVFVPYPVCYNDEAVFFPLANPSSVASVAYAWS